VSRVKRMPKKELDLIKHQYEYIFIDCPPTLSWLTINAMTAADKVIVVVSPGYFELDSIVQIRKTIEEVQNIFNPTLELAGFLFTMSDPTVNSKISLQLLRQAYTSLVFNTVIPRNTDLRDAHFDKKDIFSFNAKSGYPLKVGQLTYDCRYSTMHGMPVTGGPRL
jgi:chromosome partitioning protein